ncbi:TonB-dependent receptor [Cephaloticoccus primus]|uniref:TonB-dependent receptor n=2 Tax=Cephaloticoccus primus TaxID=1548207 RepID=A0A139SSH9_9BACT|nr:TonB-dependent receptor [Cephaloticoccus primus]
MHHTTPTRHRAILLALSVLACPSLMLGAAEDAAGGLGDATTLPPVMITADKIERRLERVPVSVAVIDGFDVEQAGITRLDQLVGRMPGLSFQPFGQAGLQAPVMRGVTAPIFSYSTSVLLLVDGVPTLTAQGFDNGLLDVDRVEVLRGPQSTLYGRNAESGVIAVHSKPMDNVSRASVSADVGSRSKQALRFAASHPLIEDRLYASISGSWLKQDGFIHNIYSGGMEDDRDHQDLNVGVRWTPQKATGLVLRYTRQRYDDGSNPWGGVGTPRAKVESGSPSDNHSLGETFSLTASHEFTAALRLRSISAYNDFRDRARHDADFRPALLASIERDSHLRTFSQELRLEGEWGRADWLVGIYGDHGDNDLRNLAERFGTAYEYTAELETEALAFFTHWNIPLTDTWTLIAGGRVERTSSELTPQTGGTQRKKDWTHFSPKLALQYQITPAHQWYVSGSRGIRAGGYNVFVSALDFPSFEPEEIWSYETGLKGWMLDQRLRYSAAVYFMDIDDMQVMLQPGPGVNYIASAAKAESKGFEIDVDYLLGGGWQLKTGVAFNDTTFDRFQDGAANYKDKRNPFAPKLSGHIGLRFDARQGWYAQAGVTGTSKAYVDPANVYRREGYAVVNLVAGYQLGDWEIAAYANNVADETYDANGYQGNTVTIYSPPREIGLRMTWRL